MKILHRSGEDYLEAILILKRKNGSVRSTDVADCLKVKKPSVSRAIGILKDGGFLIMNEDKSLVLTEIGMDVAERVYEKHCVLKEYFVSLGVNSEIAEQDACSIEHIISSESFEKIKALMAKPVAAN